MPAPPGFVPSWRTGGGFQMSNARNRRKAPSQLFQLKAVAPPADPLAYYFVHHDDLRIFVSYVRSHWPAAHIAGASRTSAETANPRSGKARDTRAATTATADRYQRSRSARGFRKVAYKKQVPRSRASGAHGCSWASSS
jgi:hypothetical protein